MCFFIVFKNRTVTNIGKMEKDTGKVRDVRRCGNHDIMLVNILATKYPKLSSLTLLKMVVRAVISSVSRIPEFCTISRIRLGATSRLAKLNSFHVLLCSK